MKTKYLFELEVFWPNGSYVKKEKAFYSKRIGYAWGAAERWRKRYLFDNSQNELGQIYCTDTLANIN